MPFVNWSPIIKWFVTLLKCTPASSAYLPPVHICIQYTSASSAHLSPVHTCLQCTRISSAHLPPIHACLQCTPASTIYVLPGHTQNIPDFKSHLPPTHICLQQDTNKFWDCSADLASSEWWRDESHGKLTFWQVDIQRVSLPPLAPGLQFLDAGRATSSWYLGNVRVCGLSLKLLFHCYF